MSYDDDDDESDDEESDDEDDDESDVNKDPNDRCPRPGCVNLRTEGNGIPTCDDCWSNEEYAFRHAHNLGYSQNPVKFAASPRGAYTPPVGYYACEGQGYMCEEKGCGLPASCKMSGVGFRCTLHAVMADKGLLCLLWCLREGMEINPARESAAESLGLLKKGSYGKRTLTDKGQAVFWEIVG